MRFLLVFAFLLTVTWVEAQDICNPAGNIMIYSNYDGGDLNIDVDVDIPDLKIGISTYEATDVTISGTYAANVTAVVFAGFNEPTISGVDPGIVTVYAAAIGDVAITSVVGDLVISGAPIVNCMVGAEGCSEYATGGGNSSPQIVDFFKNEFDDDDIFYAHWTDYSSFPAAGFQVSEGGNCCFEDPVTDPNPIYDMGGLTYDFFGADTLLVCGTDTTLDISFYPVVWGDPVWSTGETGYSITTTGPGTYYFTVGDYCHYGADLLSDSVVIEPCATEIVADICVGDLYALPDGSLTSTAGTYEFTLTAADGSDSLVIVELIVHPLSTVHIYDTVCLGDSYVLPDGSTTGATGTYYFVLSSVWGCDSFVYAHLTVLDPVYATILDSICPGGSYMLPDGTTTFAPGDYIINLLSAAGCDSILTVSLVYSDTLELFLDATICEGDSYILTDGSIVTTPGVYTTLLLPPDYECITKFIVTIDVELLVDIVLDPAAIVCAEDAPIILSASPAGGEFSGIGVSGNSFDPASAGAGGPYTITYTYTSDLGCMSVAETNITVTENYAEAGADFFITIGDTVILNVFTEGIPEWSPAYELSCTDCYNPLASPEITTTYTVTSTDAGGCIATDEVTVYVDTEPVFDFFIPNTFTPNGDGFNDVFTAYGPDLLQIASLRIYDRWGAILFEAVELPPGSHVQGWDGTKNGENLLSGVYAYVMELRFRGDFTQVVGGNVALLR
jgi:gliding motility-associated-like protein